MAQKRKRTGQKLMECRFGCGKTFGSETWKEKHEEDKCHLRKASDAGARAAASLMSRPSTKPNLPTAATTTERHPNKGDGSVEETPDMPESRPLKEPSLGSSTAAASDINAKEIRDIAKQLESKREQIIAGIPEIQRIDAALRALRA